MIEKRSFGTVPKNPPAYDPQANGAVERGAQEVMNQIRAMKIGLEQRINSKLTTSWKIMEGMVEYAPLLISRCLVGHDGKTPYARLMGKMVKQTNRPNQTQLMPQKQHGCSLKYGEHKR